jgi:hypothetical protein
MNCHLSQARSCAWYEKEKLRALGLNYDDEIHIPAPSPPHDPENTSDLENYDLQLDQGVDIEFGPYEDEFHFLQTQDLEPGLEVAENEDDEDQRVVQIDEEAGKIYRQDPPPRHCQVDKDGDSLMDNNGDANPFFPFASELDWRIAQWAVKDGPGHSAFNRLLEIPEVSKWN